VSEEAIKDQFTRLFEASSEAGLIVLDDGGARMTPEGARCLNEMLAYLEFHPRADVAKRSKRLREALHAGGEDG